MNVDITYYFIHTDITHKHRHNKVYTVFFPNRNERRYDSQRYADIKQMNVDITYTTHVDIHVSIKTAMNVDITYFFHKCRDNP